MLASLDLTRPAAREQLRALSEQAQAGILPESDAETPVHLNKAGDAGLLCKAGRCIDRQHVLTSIDEALMAERAKSCRKSG